MDEMGHTDPGLALRIYRQAMRRGEDEKAARRALVEGAEMAHIGRRAAEEPAASDRARLPKRKNPLHSGRFQHGRGGFRTCDLSRVKRALSH